MASKLGENFDKLSIAAGISNVGDGVFGAAFPLLVASITRDPFLVAGATLASRLPWLLFALLSGALVDRMDRKRVMVITNILRTVGITLMAVGIAADQTYLWVIYLVAFGLGLSETFFDTSAEAFTPRTVSEEQLGAANGRLQSLEWAGNAFVGPPLGAFLFAVAASLPFFFDAATFAIAAILIALIPGTFRSERVEKTSVRFDIADGLRWLWNQKVVRTLSIMAGVTNMFTMGIVAIFVLYAQDILGVSDTGYGLLLSSIGVGGLAGAVGAPKIVDAIGSGNTIRATLIVQILATGAFAFISSPWTAGVLMLFFGFLITAWNVVAVTLRQSLTPDDKRGRVAGASRLLAWGSQPLGALFGGATAAAFGLRSPFLISAAAFVVATALIWRIVSNESIEAARNAPRTTAAT
ncbi:MAG: MFS transporter [Acidimicrobiia bacterium]|nr:MFS transporter [Acidimicrobiia bacterium]